jgi:GTP cyclohydrolase I
MYAQELFAGLYTEPPRMMTIENKFHFDEMVCIKDIKVMSVCEHHFAPIHGFAKVAYIPKDKVVGLSKINRVVDYFSRRPQVQERLTKQIADFLCKALGTEDVAVYIDAKHYCMISRGVGDQKSTTVTSDLRGQFRTDPCCRREFLSIG